MQQPHRSQRVSQLVCAGDQRLQVVHLQAAVAVQAALQPRSSYSDHVCRSRNVVLQCCCTTQQRQKSAGRAAGCLTRRTGGRCTWETQGQLSLHERDTAAKGTLLLRPSPARRPRAPVAGAAAPPCSAGTAAAAPAPPCAAPAAAPPPRVQWCMRFSRCAWGAHGMPAAHRMRAPFQNSECALLV